MSTIQYRVTALYVDREGQHFEQVVRFGPQHTLRDVWHWAAADGDRLIIFLTMVREVSEPMPQFQSLVVDWGD